MSLVDGYVWQQTRTRVHAHAVSEADEGLLLVVAPRATRNLTGSTSVPVCKACWRRYTAAVTIDDLDDVNPELDR